MDMQPIRLRVTGQSLRFQSVPRLVARSAGVYRAVFTFDSSWAGLSKTAVFCSGGISRECLLTEGACPVPSEVLLEGQGLRIGVYGVGEGQFLPTVWAPTILVVPGAFQSEEVGPPTPTLAEQIMAKIGDLSALETEARDNLVAAINEARNSGNSDPGVSSWKDLLDKPFYAEEAEVEGLPETTISFTAAEMGVYAYMGETTAENEEGWYTDWVRARVIWDGEEYLCQPQTVDGVKCIGDSGFMTDGESTEEPFLLAVVPASMNGGTPAFVAYDLVTVVSEESISHSVQMFLITQTVKKLDAKFSPIPVDILPGSEEEVLPETTIPFTYDASEGGFVFSTAPTQAQLAAWESGWESCTVVWDGVTWECQPKYVEGIVKCVGDVGALMGTESTGEPFLFAAADLGGAFCMIYDLEASTEGAEDGVTTSSHSMSVTLHFSEQVVVQEDAIPQIDYETKVKNKPFGTVPAGTVIAQGTADCQSLMEDALYQTLVEEISLTVGAAYSVTFDGAVYRVTAADQDGMTGLVNEEAGFFFINGYVAGMTMVMAAQGSHSYTIALAEELVKKIDPAYLPENSSGLPTVTAEDNGKFLRVAEGAWAAVTVGSAEEASF